MSGNSLKSDIQASMVAAMRAQDKSRLGVIRLIQAAIKQQEIDGRVNDPKIAESGLSDEQILQVLDKMVRQRRDSIQQFKDAKRDDLVEKESYEVTIISEFLPEQLDQASIEALVKEAIQASGASSVRDMGKVMNLIRSKVQGRADMSSVSTLIKEQLGSLG